MTRTDQDSHRRPRRHATSGRITGLVIVLLLIAGSLYVAQRNDGATTSSSDVPSAQSKGASEPLATNPANQPPGKAETTGSASGGSSAPAPGGGAPPSNTSPSNTAPR